MPATKCEHHSIIIIGAGLSGLYLAWKLKLQDVIVLEARDRVGGRILSPSIGQHVDDCIDLGPAWVWPQLQPGLANLISNLNLTLFKQYTKGDMLFERDINNIERYSGQSSHQNSYRISGGVQKLTDTLVSQLPSSIIHLNTQVSTIDQNSLTVQTVCEGNTRLYSADNIIFAMPPRIIMNSIRFVPGLNKNIIELYNNTPTWMASHSKMVFIYNRPFWRDKNLSGEVFSHMGPLTEIYDGSPISESFYALTSFVGLSSSERTILGKDKLILLCMAHLNRIFGDVSQNVKDIQFKDWGTDVHTATDLDSNTPPQHPQYPVSAPRYFCNESLFIAGTETAREHGGYLEGAIESADEVLELLNKH